MKKISKNLVVTFFSFALLGSANFAMAKPSFSSGNSDSKKTETKKSDIKKKQSNQQNTTNQNQNQTTQSQWQYSDSDGNYTFTQTITQTQNSNDTCDSSDDCLNNFFDSDFFDSFGGQSSTPTENTTNKTTSNTSKPTTKDTSSGSPKVVPKSEIVSKTSSKTNKTTSKDKIKDSTKNLGNSKTTSKSSDSTPTIKSISSKVSASDFELSILAEINLMRSNPKAYAEKYIKPQITSSSSSYWTSCVRDMSKLTSLPTFSYAEGLYQCSKAHSSTQGKTNQTGHTRTNGATWSDSIKKYGSYSSCGENISYGMETPREILIQLLVDDGISSLGHRVNLLNKDYDTIGVSFDKHNYYRVMCVMNFGKNWKDK